jgi:hypothetical protein
MIHGTFIAAEAVSTVPSNSNNIQLYLFRHMVKYTHLHLKYGWSLQLCR